MNSQCDRKSGKRNMGLILKTFIISQSYLEHAINEKGSGTSEIDQMLRPEGMYAVFYDAITPPIQEWDLLSLPGGLEINYSIGRLSFLKELRAGHCLSTVMQYPVTCLKNQIF